MTLRSTFDRGWRRCICVASGPSLTDAHVESIQAAQARGWRVITVNSTWRRVPFADVLWAADRPFWNKYHADILAAGFAGELWTAAPDAALAYNLKRAPTKYVTDRRTGLKAGAAPAGASWIANGGNGGAHIVALARAFGADVILGCGYDMQHTDGRVHHHENHPMPLGNPSADQLAGWARRMEVMIDSLAKHSVYFQNCTPVSAIRRRVYDLDAMLAWWDEWQGGARAAK